MGEFRMPALGAEMTEGRLIEWLVAPGDTVHRGEIVAVVETDKAALEVEVWEDGTVAELLVPEGEKVPVGTPLARLDAVAAAQQPPEGVPPAEPVASGALPEALSEPPPDAATPRPAVPEPVLVGTSGAAAPPPAVHGPLARHRAEELGIDVSRLTGTGPGGAITRRDVEEAAGRPPPRARVSPYARRLAGERGADLGAAAGTGPGGAVVARDLDASGAVTAVREPDGASEARGTAPTATGAPAEPAPAVRAAAGPATPATVPGGAEAMRLAIARAMARSKREIPHYYLGTHVDLTTAHTWLERRNAERPAAERILPVALQLRAVALALREHPELNGFWIDEAFQPAPAVDLGVAIALRGGGLIAPAIHAADGLDPETLMAHLRDLVRRVRAGRLRAAEATQASITVTSLGDLGVETVHGVIYPPQVALVGFGRPVQRPWAVDGMLAIRQVTHVTLAADHRQTDGATGSRFLTTIEGLLQRPEEL